MNNRAIFKTIFLLSLMAISPYETLATSNSKESRSNQMDNTVLEVKTAEGSKLSYRAIVGKTNSSYYVKIEKFDRAQNVDGLGLLIETLDVLDLPGAKDVASGHITDLKWNGSNLIFKNQKASGSILKTIVCSVAVSIKNPSLVCK